MFALNFDQLVEDDAALWDLGCDTWIMDNHRWAFLVWAKGQERNGKSLLHLDAHWDAVDDFLDAQDGRSLIEGADLPTLVRLVQANELVRFDSFIAPALYRRYFESLHFFCPGADQAELSSLLTLAAERGTSVVVHGVADSLRGLDSSRDWNFDLCLDLFNRDRDGKEYEGDLWSDEEILAFLSPLQGLARGAKVVTVSLSFGYSGTEQDTRRLAALVVPWIRKTRGCE